MATSAIGAELLVGPERSGQVVVVRFRAFEPALGLRPSLEICSPDLRSACRRAVRPARECHRCSTRSGGEREPPGRPCPRATRGSAAGHLSIKARPRPLATHPDRMSRARCGDQSQTPSAGVDGIRCVSTYDVASDGRRPAASRSRYLASHGACRSERSSSPLRRGRVQTRGPEPDPGREQARLSDPRRADGPGPDAGQTGQRTPRSEVWPSRPDGRRASGTPRRVRQHSDDERHAGGHPLPPMVGLARPRDAAGRHRSRPWTDRDHCPDALVTWRLALVGGWDAAASAFLLTTWSIIGRADSSRAERLATREDPTRAPRRRC